MTKKTTRKSRSRSARLDSKNLNEVLSQIVANPLVRSVAGGLALTLLARITAKIARRYPEISHILEENLPNIGIRTEKFRENGQKSATFTH